MWLSKELQGSLCWPQKEQREIDDWKLWELMQIERSLEKEASRYGNPALHDTEKYAQCCGNREEKRKCLKCNKKVEEKNQ